MSRRLNPRHRSSGGVGGCGVGAEGALRVGIVDASELPRDRSTLLVRFMAAGPLLPQATAELAALEEGAHERAVAEQILVDLEHVLGSKAGTTPEEEEFALSGEERERILAEKDPERLERWHERAILAMSIAEVFDDESRAA